MTTSSPAAPRRGRLFLMIGLGLAILGVIGYIAQIATHRLVTPWYMPILATLGLVFLIVSLWQTRTIWRILALLFVVLLAGAEWAMLLGGRLPAYTGPVAAGQRFPSFTTMQADGSPFTQRDLQGDSNNILVFFRGRW